MGSDRKASSLYSKWEYANSMGISTWSHEWCLLVQELFVLENKRVTKITEKNLWFYCIFGGGKMEVTIVFKV